MFWTFSIIFILIMLWNALITHDYSFYHISSTNPHTRKSLVKGERFIRYVWRAWGWSGQSGPAVWSDQDSGFFCGNYYQREKQWQPMGTHTVSNVWHKVSWSTELASVYPSYGTSKGHLLPPIVTLAKLQARYKGGPLLAEKHPVPPPIGWDNYIDTLCHMVTNVSQNLILWLLG